MLAECRWVLSPNPLRVFNTHDYDHCVIMVITKQGYGVSLIYELKWSTCHIDSCAARPWPSSENRGVGRGHKHLIVRSLPTYVSTFVQSPEVCVRHYQAIRFH